ncbi:MAG: vWA domain-containing protein [Thermodesulfobacteriota bacterium]
MIQIQTGWDRYHRPLMGKHDASFMISCFAESQKRVPIHAGFFLDVSESMGRDGRLSHAKEFILSLLNNLQNGDHFTLATFHGRVTLFADDETLTDQNRPLLAERIRSLEAGGVTRLDLALETIRDRMKSSGELLRFTFLVSDGFPTDKDGYQVTDEQSYLNIAAQVGQQGKPLIVVAFGNPDSYNPVFFNAVAEKTQGSFRYSPDAHQLVASLNEDIRRMNITRVGNVRIVFELDPTLASCNWVGRAYPDKQLLVPVEKQTYILGSLCIGDPVVLIANISSYGDLDTTSGEHRLGTVRMVANTQTGCWKQHLVLSQDYTNRSDLIEYRDETVHRWYLELEETAQLRKAVQAITERRTTEAEQHINAARSTRQSLGKAINELDDLRRTLTRDNGDGVARLLELARLSRFSHRGDR